MQSASKSRSQPAAFTVAEPRRGYGYRQAVGTDTPVIWDCIFRFSEQDAVRFQLWFVVQLQRGLLEFSMPIRTEFGMVPHVCQFLPEGLLDATAEAGVWTFKAAVMARAQAVPAGYLEAAELIVGLPDWSIWSEYLDRAIAAAPEA